MDWHLTQLIIINQIVDKDTFSSIIWAQNSVQSQLFHIRLKTCFYCVHFYLSAEYFAKETIKSFNKSILQKQKRIIRTLTQMASVF